MPGTGQVYKDHSLTEVHISLDLSGLVSSHIQRE